MNFFHFSLLFLSLPQSCKLIYVESFGMGVDEAALKATQLPIEDTIEALKSKVFTKAPPNRCLCLSIASIDDKRFFIQIIGCCCCWLQLKSMILWHQMADEVESISFKSKKTSRSLTISINEFADRRTPKASFGHRQEQEAETTNEQS